MTEPEETPALKPRKVIKLRNKLEYMFVQLDIINSVLIVVGDLLREQNIESDGEAAVVLRRCASDPLFGELERLTKIIERLGGTTKLSESEQD